MTLRSLNRQRFLLQLIVCSALSWIMIQKFSFSIWLSVLLSVFLMFFCGKCGSPAYFYNEKVTQNTTIVEELKSNWTTSFYFPTFWLLDGHFQTFYLMISKDFVNPIVKYQRSKVYLETTEPLPGFITIDRVIYQGQQENTEVKDVVILVPGMSGFDSSARYVRVFAKAFSENGAREVFVMNHRGCGGASLVNAQLYSAHYTDDLRKAVQFIRNKFPETSRKFYLVGFSMGANLVTKYLGEEGSDAVFTAAAALGAPFDIGLCEKLMPKFYSKALAEAMSKLLLKFEDKFREKEDIQRFQLNVDRIRKSQTLREFDELYTRRIYGYDAVDEYYEDASSARVIRSISVPLLLLCTMDDPLCPPEVIPVQQCQNSANVLLAVTPGGGHGMEWFSGLIGTKSWAADFCLLFFKLLDKHQKKKN